MPTAAGFPALFEVAVMSAALTIACIGSCRYAARCIRRSSTLHLSGLSASLLTLFYCVYGLTYWFNGTNGYSCLSFSTIMGTSLSASTAITFFHLFMLSDSLNQTSSRWKQLRWLGLAITAGYCGSLVAVEVTRTAWEKGAGEGESPSSSAACINEARCVSEVDDAALSVKWIAQLLNQIFQVAALFIPLRSKLAATKRRSGIIRITGNYRKILIIPVLTFIILESVSLAMTTVVATLMLVKAHGRLDSMPMFAVEVLDNAANLVAVFFSADAMPLPKRFHGDSKDPQRFLHSSTLSGSKPRSLNGTFGASASSLGNDSSGGSQSLGGTCRAVNDYSTGSWSLYGHNSFGDNGGRIGNGSGYRIRRRSDGSLAGSYDGRRGYPSRGRMGTRGGSVGGFGTGGQRVRRHSIGVVSGTPSFSSFSSSSLQRRHNSENFVRRLPPLIDMSPEGRKKADSSGHESCPRSSSSSRSPSNSSSRSSRSLPVGAPSPSSPAPVGVPSPGREEPAPVPVSPSTGATPPYVDGKTKATVNKAEAAVEARAEGPSGSSSDRQGRPLGALYFSSRVAKRKSRLTRAGSSSEGDPISAGDATMQSHVALTRSRSAQPISAGGADRAAVEGTASARSAPDTALGGHGGVVVGGARELDGGDSGGVRAMGGSGGGADDGGGGRSFDANSSSASSRNPGGSTSAILQAPAPQGTGHDHLDDGGGIALAGTRTVVTLSPWKWQEQEPRGQKRQALPRPRPTNSNNHGRRPEGFNAAEISYAGGRGRGDEAQGGRVEARRVGTPAWRTTGSYRIEGNRETTASGAAAAAAALAKSGVAISEQARPSAAARAPRAGAVSDTLGRASPRTAVVSAAHTVLWPLPLKDVSSSDSSNYTPPGGRRHLGFAGLGFASSSLPVAQSPADEKQMGPGAGGAGPGWAWQKTAEEDANGYKVTAVAAAAAAAPRGSVPPSSFLGGPAMIDVEPALAAKAVRVAAAVAGAAASTAAPKAPLERRSSSSGTCRSGVSGVAWSAFSAASWCSTTFDGDETPKEGAPASTVRSPASYFAGAGDNG